MAATGQNPTAADTQGSEPPDHPDGFKTDPQGRSTDLGFRNPANHAARIRIHAGQPRRLPTTTRIRTYTLTTAA